MPNLRLLIAAQIKSSSFGRVWVPADFAQLGHRDVVDKALQRMVTAGELRRIDRGLYDKPMLNTLTKRLSTADYREVIGAIARRDKLRILVDGMTAANDLGLTDAVPARVTLHTDARRRSIQVDQLLIEFKTTAASRLYWAERPAMRVVQALYWLKDTFESDADHILRRLEQILADAMYGAAITQDLADGFSVLPAWMQNFLRQLPAVEHELVGANFAKQQQTTKPPAPQKPRMPKRRVLKAQAATR